MFTFFSDEDLDAVRHLMYLVGKNLGIKDEFNLCTGDLNECKAYCHEILVRKQGTLIGETRTSNWFLNKLGCNAVRFCANMYTHPLYA